jgi:replicative DNA helicase
MNVAENLSSPAAEWSVVANMLTDPNTVGEVVGTQLAAEDFTKADSRGIYEVIVERYFADQSVEPLVVADRLQWVLASLWKVKEAQVGDEFLKRLKERDYGHGVVEHAGIVKRLSTARQLLLVADRARSQLGEGKLNPEEIASSMSTEALAVTSGSVRRTELLNWMETGTEYVKYLARLRLAKEKGIELAVYTGLPCIDNFTGGIGPGELCFLAGAAGAGKSTLSWKASEGFAARQMPKAPDHRIATLVVSMEMGSTSSSGRLVQSITEIDGTRLREGNITDQEYKQILREWKARDGLPIYFNYSSNFRLSQLRALIVEGIRRYNVGFVVLDHFRQIDTDKYIRDANDRDEEKVRFLKEGLAKDLGIAVMCLAHTIKIGRANEGAAARPRLDDLRGSGTIAANADFVGFLYKPGENLDEDEKSNLGIEETDAELIWSKSRHTGKGIAYLGIDHSRMLVWPR